MDYRYFFYYDGSGVFVQQLVIIERRLFGRAVWQLKGVVVYLQVYL